MEIITLLLFLFFGTGITNLVVNASVFDNLRSYVIKKSHSIHNSFGLIIEKLLSCMMCSGFWIGIVISFFFPVNLLVGGVIISLISHLYGTVIEALTSIVVISESINVENVEAEDEE